MRTKVTLILLALNVALALFIFVYEREWRGERELLEARRRVLGPESAGIRTLQMSGPGGELRLERKGESWALVAPVAWPANDFAVRRILSELQLLEHETAFSLEDLERGGQSLADFGLAEPRLTLAYAAEPLAPGSKPVSGTLRIGADTAVGNRLYVLTADDRVHVVGHSLADSLALSLAQLRSDAVFTIPVFEVRSFNLQTAVRIRLRRDNARWAFEAPIVTRAAKLPTELAINDLNALRVRRFLPAADAAAARTGLATPSIRVTLEGNNRRETLLLGAPVAGTPAQGDEAVEYFAQLEDRPDTTFVVALPARLLDTLSNAQVALRSRRLLDFDPAAVTAVTLVAPGQPELTLQRLDATPDAWQIMRRNGASGPNAVPADPLLVERLLQRFSLLDATDFHADAPSAADLENLGFNRPDRRVTIQLAAPAAGGPVSAPASLVIELARRGGDDPALYARIIGQPFIYTVPAETLATTPVSALVYRDRTLRTLPAGALITALALRPAAEGPAVYEHTLAEDETWPQALAAEPEARRVALDALLVQLRTLRAKTIVSDSVPERITVNGEARPWAWKLEATLALGGEDQPVVSTLLVAERGGGGTQLLAAPDLGLVFEAEQPLVDALWTLIYANRDPGPGPVPAAKPAVEPEKTPAPEATPVPVAEPVPTLEPVPVPVP